MSAPITMENAPDVLSVKEAAEILRVSTATIYDAVRDGNLRGMKLRKRVLIDKKALTEFISGTPAH